MPAGGRCGADCPGRHRADPRLRRVRRGGCRNARAGRPDRALGRGRTVPACPQPHVPGGPGDYRRPALALGQLALLPYGVAVGAAFATFVYWYEEPALRHRFGAEYEAYPACRASLVAAPTSMGTGGDRPVLTAGNGTVPASGVEASASLRPPEVPSVVRKLPSSYTRNRNQRCLRAGSDVGLRRRASLTLARLPSWMSWRLQRPEPGLVEDRPLNHSESSCIVRSKD